jgi:hypothetical protein
VPGGSCFTLPCREGGTAACPAGTQCQACGEEGLHCVSLCPTG